MMKNRFRQLLENIFQILHRKLTIILLFFIIVVSLFLFSSYLNKILFVLLFVVLGGISKFYHRFLKSTLGIDLVFFTSIMAALVYGKMPGFIVAILGLLIADTIGARFSHTSLISFFGLISVVFLSSFLTHIEITAAAFILAIAYEIIAVALYYVMGSSLQGILIFIVSHIVFNSFLIFSFANTLKQIMI